MAVNLNNLKDKKIEFTDDNLKFGSEAQQLNATNPNYISGRNDYIINNVNPKFKTFDEANAALTTGLTALKSKNLGVGEQDWNNTQINLTEMLKKKYPTVITPPVVAPVTTPTVATPNATKGPLEIARDVEVAKVNATIPGEVKNTYASYNLGKADYEKNKGYYVNFDEQNNKFNNVLNSLQTTQAGNNNAPLTDAQYQQVANQYGVTMDEVKNPLSLFSKGLQMTDAGKQALGVSNWEQDQANAKTAFERNKEDMATNLKIQEQNINNQIQDVQKQLDRNLSWAVASGTVSGAMASSGYKDGIQNIDKDAKQTIGRLNTMLQNIQNASDKDVGRLTEDYNKAVTAAKVDFDKQMEGIKQNYGIQLTGMTDKYGMGTTGLISELDKVMEGIGTKTMDVWTKYYQNRKLINEEIQSNMKLKEDQLAYEDKVTSKRFNEYLANNGQVLANTSLKTLQDEVISGKLPEAKYNDLKNIMLTSIQTTLGKSAPMDSTDIQTATHLLDTGKTMAEVVASFQSMEKFKPKKSIEKSFDLGNVTRVYYSDNSYEDIPKGSEAMSDYQKAQLGLDKTKLDQEQQKIDISGQLTQFKVGNKTVTVDSGLQNNLETALSEMPGVIVGSTTRTKEQQQELYDKYLAGGGKAAKPGMSKHEVGAAIDIYGGKDKNGKLLPPTQEQIDIMSSYGWKQTAGAGDKGHFEYVGGEQPQTQTPSKYLNVVKTIQLPYQQNKTVTSSIQNALDSGDEQLARSIAYNAISSSLPTEQKGRFTASTEMAEAVKGLGESLQAFYKAGGTTNLIKGKINDIERMVGESNNPELQRIWVNVQNQMDIVRRARSGAALTKNEEAMYNNMFPGIDKVGELNFANINGLVDSAKNTVKSIMKSSKINTNAFSDDFNRETMFEDGTKIEQDNNGKYRWFNGTQWSEWTPEGQSNNLQTTNQPIAPQDTERLNKLRNIIK